jgi:hypothetical protein
MGRQRPNDNAASQHWSYALGAGNSRSYAFAAVVARYHLLNAVSADAPVSPSGDARRMASGPDRVSSSLPGSALAPDG